MKKILFVIDKIEYKYFEFNDLVTNFWLIKEFINKGYELYITTIDKLFLEKFEPKCYCNKCYIKNSSIRKDDIFFDKNNIICSINNFNAVFFRPDPPVDIDYINATYIFDYVNRQNVKLINDPKSIRNFNEKLHTGMFPNYIPDSLITSLKSEILKFVEKNDNCIIKPLNKCFGSGVFYLKKNDLNLNTIIDNSTNNGSNVVMVQKFIESDIHGDKRILILGASVLEFGLNKIPNKNDFKFSSHNDETIKPIEISNYEYKMSSYIAKELNKMSIFMAGLDIIDDHIIEINVTSPCYFIREVNNIYNINLEKIMIEYFETLINTNLLV